MAHPELGSKILDEVLESVGPAAKVDTQARFEGRSMTMVLSPDKQAQEAMKKAAVEAAKEAEAATAAAETDVPIDTEAPTESLATALVEDAAEVPEVAEAKAAEVADAADTATAESETTE